MYVCVYIYIYIYIYGIQFAAFRPLAPDPEPGSLLFITCVCVFNVALCS